MAPPLKLTPSSQSEEREGLLADVDALSFIEADESKYSSSSDTITLWSLGLAALVRIAVVVGAFLGLIFGLLYWLSDPQSSIRTLHFNGDTLRSNGTHDFKRTVLLVSIDGLRHALSDVTHPLAANITHRADYLDRGFTPHLLDISKKGVRAKFMKPVFPVSTLSRSGGTLLIVSDRH